MSPRRSPAQARAWLAERPPLGELRAAYPADWAIVEREVAALTADGDIDVLKAAVLELANVSAAPGAGGGGGAASVSRMVRRQMKVAALKQLLLDAAGGGAEAAGGGRRRLGKLTGGLAQRLLFDGPGFRRKAVSNRWFSLVWPQLGQRHLVMPLVERKGIYCFYSRNLIAALRDLIANRTCLEIAAGDGTLSRLLGDAGVAVTATDDRSWSHSITFPESVLDQDAAAALREHTPQVVLCSWPPAGNRFERAVFTTESVELYVVIGSRHTFASGDWATYERQTDFAWGEAPELSALVLPPEIEPAVYVFRRR